jgi:hypothetical protein
MVKQVCSDAVEIVEPAKEGYQLTLKLNLAKIPRGKGLLLLQIIAITIIIYKKTRAYWYFVAHTSAVLNLSMLFLLFT